MSTREWEVCVYCSKLMVRSDMIALSTRGMKTLVSLGKGKYVDATQR